MTDKFRAVTRDQGAGSLGLERFRGFLTGVVGLVVLVSVVAGPSAAMVLPAAGSPMDKIPNESTWNGLEWTDRSGTIHIERQVSVRSLPPAFVSVDSGIASGRAGGGLPVSQRVEAVRLQPRAPGPVWVASAATDIRVDSGGLSRPSSASALEALEKRPQAVSSPQYGAGTGNRLSEFGAKQRALTSEPVTHATVAGVPGETQTGQDQEWRPLLFGSLLINIVLGTFVLLRHVGTWEFTPLSDRLSSLLLGRSDASSAPVERVAGDDLLPDEAVVEQLLEENDGQLRQSEIVESTEWSKAKVSRLLCEKESDGDIVKIQIGRENLVCLDGEQPEIATSLD